MSWTDERVELMRKLWLEGLSASQIAAELSNGITRNAVIGKVHRLGLSGRAKAPKQAALPPRAPSTPRQPRAAKPPRAWAAGGRPALPAPQAGLPAVAASSKGTLPVRVVAPAPPPLLIPDNWRDDPDYLLGHDWREKFARGGGDFNFMCLAAGFLDEAHGQRAAAA